MRVLSLKKQKQLSDVQNEYNLTIQIRSLIMKHEHVAE